MTNESTNMSENGDAQELTRMLSPQLIIELSAGEVWYLETKAGLPAMFRGGMIVAEPADDPVPTLEGKQILTEEATVAPWFRAVWSMLSKPVAVVSVSRTVDTGGYRWTYMLSPVSFAELVQTDLGVVMLIGTIEKLAARIAFTSGLLRYSRVEGAEALDPLAAHDEFVTVVGVCANAQTASSPEWGTVDFVGKSSVIRPIDEAKQEPDLDPQQLLDQIERLLNQNATL